MAKETSRGLFYNSHLFGESLDFPENLVLFLSKKWQEECISLEIEMETIEIALQQQGDIAMDSQGSFLLYDKERKVLIGCHVEGNRIGPGFFVSVLFVKRVYRLDPEKQEYPIIII